MKQINVGIVVIHKLITKIMYKKVLKIPLITYNTQHV